MTKSILAAVQSCAFCFKFFIYMYSKRK